MKRETLDAGAIIFDEGMLPDTVGYIVEGEAQISMRRRDDPDNNSGGSSGGGRVVIGSAVAGDYIGEMAALEGRLHGATVIASSPMTIDFIPSSEFLTRAVNDSALAHRLLMRMSARLHHLNSIYADAAGVPATVPVGETPPPVRAVGGIAEGLSVSLRPGPGLAGRVQVKVPDPLPLPFSVGRRPSQQEGAPLQPISLPLDDRRPFRLSRAHFTILRDGNEICVQDLHSHLGTEVNGRFIGLQFGGDIATLKSGDNLVVAGGHDSPFVFHLHVSR